MFHCDRIFHTEKDKWFPLNDDRWDLPLKMSLDQAVFFFDFKRLRIRKEPIELTPEEIQKWEGKKKPPAQITAATLEAFTSQGKKSKKPLPISHKYQGKFTKIYPHYNDFTHYFSDCGMPSCWVFKCGFWKSVEDSTSQPNISKTCWP